MEWFHKDEQIDLDVGEEIRIFLVKEVCYEIVGECIKVHQRRKHYRNLLELIIEGVCPGEAQVTLRRRWRHTVINIDVSEGKAVKLKLIED